MVEKKESLMVFCSSCCSCKYRTLAARAERAEGERERVVWNVNEERKREERGRRGEDATLHFLKNLS